MADGLPRTGGCLCGAVRFTAKVGAQMGVCHCGMCRRWSGGVFMAVPATDLTIENEVQLGVYRSSDYGERVFCKICGSTLLWRMQDGSSAAVSLPALDDQSGVAFAEEIFIDDKPTIYAFANATAKLTGPEAMAQFAAEERADG